MQKKCKNEQTFRISNQNVGKTFSGFCWSLDEKGLGMTKIQNGGPLHECGEYFGEHFEKEGDFKNFGDRKWVF